jgi:hypothetical protein
MGVEFPIKIYTVAAFEAKNQRLNSTQIVPHVSHQESDRRCSLDIIEVSVVSLARETTDTVTPLSAKFSECGRSR